MASYKYSVYNSQKHSGRRGGGSGYRSGGGNKRRGDYIDPSRFVAVAKPTQAEDYTPKHKFSDFKVEQLILDNIAAKGFTTPSPIQDQTIPLGLEGKDVIGIANTGTGKTAAFSVPMLHSLMSRQNAKALIIAPTRELAQQIEAECRSIAKGSGLSGAVLIGGTGMGGQLRDLRNRPRIVIGTPGRIKDHVERRTINLEQFNIVVLDEVDRMLDMGFIHDIKKLLKVLPEKRQTLFFSATMAPEARISASLPNFATTKIKVSKSASKATIANLAGVSPNFKTSASAKIATSTGKNTSTSSFQFFL